MHRRLPRPHLRPRQPASERRHGLYRKRLDRPRKRPLRPHHHRLQPQKPTRHPLPPRRRFDCQRHPLPLRQRIRPHQRHRRTLRRHPRRTHSKRRTLRPLRRLHPPRHDFRRPHPRIPRRATRQSPAHFPHARHRANPRCRHTQPGPPVADAATSPLRLRFPNGTNPPPAPKTSARDENFPVWRKSVIVLEPYLSKQR